MKTAPAALAHARWLLGSCLAEPLHPAMRHQSAELSRFSAVAESAHPKVFCVPWLFFVYMLLTLDKIYTILCSSAREMSMTRQDLLEIFNGSPDGPMRLLRRINGNQQMFAGSPNCRRALVDAGFIAVVAQEGRYYRLSVTDRGQQALGA